MATPFLLKNQRNYLSNLILIREHLRLSRYESNMYIGRYHSILTSTIFLSYVLTRVQNSYVQVSKFSSGMSICFSI